MVVDVKHVKKFRSDVGQSGAKRAICKGSSIASYSVPDNHNNIAEQTATAGRCGSVYSTRSLAPYRPPLQ